MEVLQIDSTEINTRFIMIVVDSFNKRAWFVLLIAKVARSVAAAFFSKIVT